MAIHKATIHPFPAQGRTACNYCKRLINTTTITANNAVYDSKLCAAVGLIAEVHADDEICEEHLESLTEGVIGSVFYGGPVGIPVKVRWSDSLEFDEKAPEGFAFQIIPIDDEGTPDWVPDPTLHPSQEQVDHAVEDLLRDGDGAEGRP